MLENIGIEGIIIKGIAVKGSKSSHYGHGNVVISP